MLDFCFELNFKYDFDQLTKYLDSLPNISEILKVLHTLKYDFEREIELAKSFPHSKTGLSSQTFDFGKNCQLEIEKYTVLIQLEEKETEKKTGNKEFSTTRQVLALRYLLNFAKAKDKRRNAQKKFIHFLIDKDLSTIGKKFDDDGLAYSKDGEDLSFIREQFESIGLTEIVRMIDNDKS